MVGVCVAESVEAHNSSVPCIIESLASLLGFFWSQIVASPLAHYDCFILGPLLLKIGVNQQVHTWIYLLGCNMFFISIAMMMVDNNVLTLSSVDQCPTYWRVCFVHPADIIAHDMHATVLIRCQWR